MELLLKILRRLLQAVFLLAAAGFFALCLAGFAHSPGLDSSWLLVQFRRLGNPVLHLVSRSLGIAAGTALAKFLPLGLAVASLGLFVLIDLVLAKASVALTLAPARRKPAEAAPRAPQPVRVGEPQQVPRPSAEPRRERRPEARPELRPAPKVPPKLRPKPEPLPQPEAQPKLEMKKWPAEASRVEATQVLNAPPVGGLPGSVEKIEVGIPKKIGRYDILQELGRGGMGVVYKAQDSLLHRTVAIKLILTANVPDEDPGRYKRRFYREAEVAARMNHPDIVAIYDVGEDKSTGQPYLVMEFVEGVPLEDLLERTKGPLPLEKSLDIGIQAAKAMEYAHRQGVVHRDIKPANIMINPEGKVEITDFGIARLAGSQMTQLGQVLGTPAYMSPEQLMGGQVDGRSDIFSLGIVLYQMLTGKMAFSADTLPELMLRIIQNTPTPAREWNPNLPPDIEPMLSKCLVKVPAERYQTASELVADLEALRAPQGLPSFSPKATQG